MAIHYRINLSKLTDTVPFEDIDLSELKTELDFNLLIDDLKLVMQDGYAVQLNEYHNLCKGLY